MEEAAWSKAIPTKPRWIIDPLDGTTNFLHGIPHFAISIAVQEPALDGSGWGDDRRAGLSADDRRKLLGRKEPRRLVAGPPPARFGASQSR
jgi:hypothetical protein